MCVFDPTQQPLKGVRPVLTVIFTIGNVDSRGKHQSNFINRALLRVLKFPSSSFPKSIGIQITSQVGLSSFNVLDNWFRAHNQNKFDLSQCNKFDLKHTPTKQQPVYTWTKDMSLRTRRSKRHQFQKMNIQIP